MQPEITSFSVQYKELEVTQILFKRFFQIPFRTFQLIQKSFLRTKCWVKSLPQLTFTYSKSTMETLEKGVKYVQS